MSIFLYVGLIIFVFIVWEVTRKQMFVWLPSYIKRTFSGKSSENGTRHIIFSLVDHFEPNRGRAGYDRQVKRLDTWIKEHQKIAIKHRDSHSKYPQHTFFYPEEEYSKEHLDKIAQVCRNGFGEVEIHLHHDNDTAEGLTQKLISFKDKLLQHGLLSKDKDGETAYSFIHGNWALDNSRNDGRWCGVNNELSVLKKTGCYADLTLPSAPSDTQTSKINSIYYATGRPGKSKSHNVGIDVEVGKEADGDLMIIQGPLALNWKKRKFGIFPRIENSDITVANPPTKDRVDLWIKQNIVVKGKSNWVFVKVHTHGLKDENLKKVFFENLDAMYSYLESDYNDGLKFRLHYTSSREMYNIIKAAEDGKDGNPSDYRDYILLTNIESKAS